MGRPDASDAQRQIVSSEQVGLPPARR